jgi:hypothetical protein
MLKAGPVARSYLWMYRSGVTCRLCRETKRQAPLISRTQSVRTLSRQAAALRGKRALSWRGEVTQGPKISRAAQVHVHLLLICPLSWIISQLSLHLRDGRVAPAVKEVHVDWFFGYCETLFQLHVVTMTWIICDISAYTYGENVRSGGPPCIPCWNMGVCEGLDMQRGEKNILGVCCLHFEQTAYHFNITAKNKTMWILLIYCKYPKLFYSSHVGDLVT